MVKRTADVKWTGTLREGRGTIATQSTAVNASYSIRSRMEDGPGTNPEELLGAAHAACFTMALTAILSGEGLKPTELSTHAAVGLAGNGTEFSIPEINLEVHGVVPGIDEATFQRHAATAKATCPVSKALAGVATITLRALLKQA
ncbi:MAG: Organic hydroperoxide resistance protein [Labilithrix sp.]|jgi:osmotically inducible protein OsmC|nr:Organic hydroperoxide resistance protein [Labilithrix sp.]